MALSLSALLWIWKTNAERNVPGSMQVSKTQDAVKELSQILLQV